MKKVFPDSHVVSEKMKQVWGVVKRFSEEMFQVSIDVNDANGIAKRFSEEDE